MSDKLASAWAKLDRAKFHVDALQQEIAGWTKDKIGRQPFGVVIESDDNYERSFVIRVGEVVPLPTLWSLMIGDALCNFRASLDHLAWQLVQVGQSPNPDNPHEVGFPIRLDDKGIRSILGQKLPGVGHRHLAIVRRYQPYNQSPPSSHPLAILNDLSGKDKHRTIRLVEGRPQTYNFDMKIEGFAQERYEQTPPPLMIRKGTELMRFYGRKTGQATPKVEMTGDFSVGIAFEDNTWVISTLNTIGAMARVILSEFEPIV